MIVRKTLIAIAIGAITSTVTAGPLFIEKPREKMPELVMPKSQFSTMKQEPISDSQPRTRHTISEMVKNYQGFEWKNTEDGARQHLEYDRGVHGLSEAQKATLTSYAESLPAQPQIVVVGYADEEGSSVNNKELAMSRGQRVSRFLSAQRKDINVTTLHSVLWPGDPADGRRTEVLQIIQRTLKKTD